MFGALQVTTVFVVDPAFAAEEEILMRPKTVQEEENGESDLDKEKAAGGN